jgi:hypothetical protein
MLEVCEKRNWDGSEYNTIIKDWTIGENFGKDIIVKCNKAEKETDAMIGIFDALPGIEIKNDAEDLEDAE